MVGSHKASQNSTSLPPLANAGISFFALFPSVLNGWLAGWRRHPLDSDVQEHEPRMPSAPAISFKKVLQDASRRNAQPLHVASACCLLLEMNLTVVEYLL